MEKNHIKVARIYMRVSTDEQDIARQESLIADARGAEYYIAGVYREVACGARADRPVLERLIADLQPGDVVIAEKLDRLTRLPLIQAEQLIARIQEKGARLSIPGVVDLSHLEFNGNDFMRRVIEEVQRIFLLIALQAARDDYEDRLRRQKEGIALAKKAGRYTGRPPNKNLKANIIRMRTEGVGIVETAKRARCSQTHVKKVWREHKDNIKEGSNEE